MKIPNAEQAVVDIRKLTDYCLNHEHPRGKHKARVFLSALGMTSANAEELADALLQKIMTEKCAVGTVDEYGARYIVDFTYARGSREAGKKHLDHQAGRDHAAPYILFCVMRSSGHVAQYQRV